MALFRSFVGISLDLPDAVQINSALEKIKSAVPEQSVRWVPIRNWHVTLAFLGDQSEEELAQLAENLAASLFDVTEFEIGLSRIEIFPDSSSRVVAGWVSSTPALSKLHQRVYQTLTSLDIIVNETQAFLPHVTLGRIRKGRSAVLSAQPVNIVLNVKHVTVFRSQRTPQGSIYTPLSSVPLMKPLK